VLRSSTARSGSIESLNTEATSSGHRSLGRVFIIEGICMLANPSLRTIRERRSSLVFSSDPVTDDQVDAILEAGRWAPSARNSQPWDFVVVRKEDLRNGLAIILRRITWGWGGFSKVPVMIVISVDPSKDPEHYVEDGAVAAQNICLAAHSLGLASSWAGIHGSSRADAGHVEQEIKEALSLPETHRIIAIVPIGVAGADDHQSSRRPLADMVHLDRFGAPYTVSAPEPGTVGSGMA
jgi:nitroreductase